MKRLFLVLLCLLASPALADDAVTSFGWNSVTGTFQGLTRALGWKNVPDTDYGTFGASWSGAYTSVATVTARYSRVGKLVTFFMPLGTAACNGATTINAAAATIPSSLRPAAAQAIAVQVYDNSSYPANVMGEVNIGTDGSMTIYKTISGGAFTAAGNCGIPSGGFTVTYPIN